MTTFSYRTAGSPAARESPDRDYRDYSRTKRSCSKRGENHPSVFGGTNAAYSDNDEDYEASIY